VFAKAKQDKKSGRCQADEAVPANSFPWLLINQATGTNRRRRISYIMHAWYAQLPSTKQAPDFYHVR